MNVTEIPLTNKRLLINGKIISIHKYPSSFNDGYQISVLVQHPDGWKVYGTLPKSVRDSKEGDEIEFSALIKPSKNYDFGIFSRPTKARIVNK